MKKILTLATVMVFAASATFAADLPYENDEGGNDGPDGDQSEVTLSSRSGRDLPSENDGGGTPDDPGDVGGVSWTVEMGRAFQLIGLIP